MKIVLALATLILTVAASAVPLDRNIKEYNLTGHVGLKGYDPVAVFPEGGGKPTLGKPELGLEFAGVMYFFASSEHRVLFMQNPDKYEPTYGGYCAYAMSEGVKVDIQPQLFTLHGNRAHYFVSGRAKANFDLDVEGREKLADGFWKQMSGEEPRL